jgi:hypothetical protein
MGGTDRSNSAEISMKELKTESIKSCAPIIEGGN